MLQMNSAAHELLSWQTKINNNILDLLINFPSCSCWSRLTARKVWQSCNKEFLLNLSSPLSRFDKDLRVSNSSNKGHHRVHHQCSDLAWPDHRLCLKGREYSKGKLLQRRFPSESWTILPWLLKNWVLPWSAKSQRLPKTRNWLTILMFTCLFEEAKTPYKLNDTESSHDGGKSAMGLFIDWSCLKDHFWGWPVSQDLESAESNEPCQKDYKEEAD